MVWRYAVIVVVGYLLGNISMGLIVSERYHMDIREPVSYTHLFSQDDTSQGVFFSPNGEIETDFMYIEHTFRYGERAGAQIVCLPYGGMPLAMYVICLLYTSFLVNVGAYSMGMAVMSSPPSRMRTAISPVATPRS